MEEPIVTKWWVKEAPIWALALRCASLIFIAIGFGFAVAIWYMPEHSALGYIYHQIGRVCAASSAFMMIYSLMLNQVK